MTKLGEIVILVLMKLHDLQAIVIVEAICLTLILLIIVATFRRWKRILFSSIIFATIAFFSAWSNTMALASTLVYGSASTLLWWQIDERHMRANKTQQLLQKLAWSILATGVAILILNNLNNIFVYLRH